MIPEIAANITTKGIIILIGFITLVVLVVFYLFRTELKKKRRLDNRMNNRPRKVRKRRSSDR